MQGWFLHWPSSENATKLIRVRPCHVRFRDGHDCPCIVDCQKDTKALVGDDVSVHKACNSVRCVLWMAGSGGLPLFWLLLETVLVV